MHPGAQLVRTAGGRAVGALYRPACNSPSVRGPCVVASPAGVVLGGRRCGSATVSPHEREPNRGSAAARAAHRGRKSPVRCRGRAAARLDLSRCRSDFQIITHRTLHQASEVRRHIPSHRLLRQRPRAHRQFVIAAASARIARSGRGAGPFPRRGRGKPQVRKGQQLNDPGATCRKAGHDVRCGCAARVLPWPEIIANSDLRQIRHAARASTYLNQQTLRTRLVARAQQRGLRPQRSASVVLAVRSPRVAHGFHRADIQLPSPSRTGWFRSGWGAAVPRASRIRDPTRGGQRNHEPQRPFRADRRAEQGRSGRNPTDNELIHEIVERRLSRRTLMRGLSITALSTATRRGFSGRTMPSQPGKVFALKSCRRGWIRLTTAPGDALRARMAAQSFEARLDTPSPFSAPSGALSFPLAAELPTASRRSGAGR